MSSFQQVAEGNVDAEITLMEWNPIKDLIVLATVAGKVLLYKHSWEKVWEGINYILTQNTKEKTILITALAWRPDGEILASAFDNGEILLCDAENGEMLHVVVRSKTNVAVFLDWVQQMENPDSESCSVSVDSSKEFLPKYFPYSTEKSSNLVIKNGHKKLHGQKYLNFLVSAFKEHILLHSFGVYQIGSISISIEPENMDKIRVVSVRLARDLQVLTVVFKRPAAGHWIFTKDFGYSYQAFYLSLISDKMEEIRAVSLKHQQIISLSASLNSFIKQMSDCWEGTKIEIDAKFHKYIREKNEEGTSITDDILETIISGTPSDSLKRFLLRDLTEDDIEKFLFSIEKSCSNIQNLIVNYLQIYASAIFYHLNEAKEMAVWKSFESLMLEVNAINTTMAAVGSFLLKTVEIQQVVSSSLNNMIAFFRWLHVMILQLTNKQIPSETLSAAQQGQRFAEQFLKDNFHTRHEDEGCKTTVNLERFDQYLKAEDLHSVTEFGNPWNKFLEDHPNFIDTMLVFSHYPKKSLVTQFTDIYNALLTVLNCQEKLIHEKVHDFHFAHFDNEPLPIISHISCSETGSSYFTEILAETNSSFSFYRHGFFPGSVAVTFSDADGHVPSSIAVCSHCNKTYKVTDVKFYGECIMVLLMEDTVLDTNCSVLLLLPLKKLCLELVDFHDEALPYEIQDKKNLDGLELMKKNCFKRLDDFRASQIAVSASHKFVCVFSASQRQVRIFNVETLVNFKHETKD